MERTTHKLKQQLDVVLMENTRLNVQLKQEKDQIGNIMDEFKQVQTKWEAMKRLTHSPGSRKRVIAKVLE